MGAGHPAGFGYRCRPNVCFRPIADIGGAGHPSDMKTRRKRSRGLLLSVPLTLGGCDPGVHIAWKEDFEQPVDADCIERSLRVVAPDVSHTSYVSDGLGSRGFPNGTEVTQFNYSDPTLIGDYSLDVATLPNGKTRYWHGWGKLGTDVADEEQVKVAPLLNRANQSVARNCGLSFKEAGPREGDG